MSSTVQINNDGYIGKKKPVLYRLKTPASKYKNQKQNKKIKNMGICCKHKNQNKK